MKYLTLIYGDAAAWEALSEEEQQKVSERYMALSREAAVADGAELQDSDTATTVRVRDGETLTTDGPFAETKEQLAGYYMIDCDNLDQAIEAASKAPSVGWGGSIEVRPIQELPEPPES